MALFESYERRIAQVTKFLKDNGISSIQEAEKTQQMVYVTPGFGAGVGQQFFHYGGRHLFHQIRRIIRHQIVHDVGSLPDRQGCDYGLLHLYGQVGKDVRRHILGQYPEELELIVFRQFLQHLGYIRLIQIIQTLSYL